MMINLLNSGIIMNHQKRQHFINFILDICDEIKLEICCLED
jgi:hypothetical protein